MRARDAVLASLFAGSMAMTQAAELSTSSPLSTSAPHSTSAPLSTSNPLTPSSPLDSAPGTLPRASGGGALPADEAFALNTVVEADGDIVIVWEMPPSYYLYRKSLALAHAERDLLPALELPDGAHVTDEFFGESEVYFERLLARLPAGALDAAPGTTLELQLSYQGCREDVYCYPPQHTLVSITLP